jgi:hypothetical protein
MRAVQGRRSRWAAAAVAVVAAMSVAGCSQNSPTVAAYVGSETITNDEIESAVQGINEAIGEQGPVPRQEVVTAMVLGEVSAQIAERRDLEITDAERTAKTNPQLLAFPEAKAVAFDLADSVIVQEELGPEEYLAEIKATEVTVNPRYGVWNPDARDRPLLDPQAGSLSQSVLSPTS